MIYGVVFPAGAAVKLSGSKASQSKTEVDSAQTVWQDMVACRHAWMLVSKAVPDTGGESTAEVEDFDPQDEQVVEYVCAALSKQAKPVCQQSGVCERVVATPVPALGLAHEPQLRAHSVSVVLQGPNIHMHRLC